MSLRYGANVASKAKIPFRAIPYQRKDDPTRALAERYISPIRAALASALKALRDAVPVKPIADKIAARDLTGAADLVNIETFKHDLRVAFAKITETYAASASTIGAVKKDATTFSGEQPAPDRFAFDLYTEEVAAELADFQGALIGNLTDDMRRRIFDAVAKGVQDNVDPRDIAASIRDQIGLSDRLAKAVVNYRLALETGDAAALARSLRDVSADGDVSAAIAQGVALDPERIDALVDAYVDRALDYRADMIARTEASRAANMGLQAGYRQAIADGVFPSVAVKQYWMVALDEKTCLACILVAVAANAGISLDAPFIAEGEEIDAPPLHPNCRCSLEIRTDLDLVDI